MSSIKEIAVLIRFRHWSKSAFVLLGVFYAEAMDYLGMALIAALSFSFVASAVYIYNDIQDRFQDYYHPFKKYRVLVKGTISLKQAYFIMLLCLFIGLLTGWWISNLLFMILFLYFLINIFYNHFLKMLPLLDVVCIALGFMLRVLAGTIGIGLSVSWWLTVTATLLSLFIALGKRRLELHLDLSEKTRLVLKKYNSRMLQNLMLISATACLISYVLYTLIAKNASFYFLLTLPFAAFALWRFSWLCSIRQERDDPLNVFLMDWLSQLNFICFFILTFMGLRQ